MIKVILYDADGVLITGEMFSQKLARKFGIKTELYTNYSDFEAAMKSYV